MKHILIVEDDPLQAYLLQTIINKLGLLSTVCTNVFLILEKCRRRLFDAITVDLDLPDINGMDLVRQVRQCDKKIPIIAITSDDGESKRIECMQLGATWFLVRPGHDAALKQILKTLSHA